MKKGVHALLLVGILHGASVLLMGCGDNKVSHETVETSRSVANANSEYNARAWKSTNIAYSGFKILSRGDSTQSRECPNGDGWASIDLVNENGQTKAQLKCSTYSASIGCMLQQDFQKKRFYQEDGNCSEEVPDPLQKIVK